MVGEDQWREGMRMVWRNRKEGLGFYRLIEQQRGFTVATIGEWLQASYGQGEDAALFSMSGRSSWG